MPSSLAPSTKLPAMLMKKPTKDVTAQQSHHLGTRSKNKVNSIALQSSYEDETKKDSTALESSSEDGKSFGVVRNLFNHLSTKHFGGKEVTGTCICSSILHANNPFYCYVILIYMIAVGSCVVMACQGLTSED